MSRTIAFVCFYHAERVLSAPAKFLVHLLGESERQGEMGEWRIRGSGEGRGRVWRGDGNAREKTPRNRLLVSVCSDGRLTWVDARSPCERSMYSRSLVSMRGCLAGVSCIKISQRSDQMIPIAPAIQCTTIIHRPLCTACLYH